MKSSEKNREAVKKFKLLHPGYWRRYYIPSKMKSENRPPERPMVLVPTKGLWYGHDSGRAQVAPLAQQPSELIKGWQELRRRLRK